MGVAFLATIVTRPYAGARVDRLGGESSMQYGLILYAIAALVCLASSGFPLSIWDGYAPLVAGRLILGLGESMAMVGAIQWGLVLMDPQRSAE